MLPAIISLTTIPDRVPHLRPTLESLLAQELPVYLWAVREIPRSRTVLEAVPEWITALGVHAALVPDCGPLTKLLPALKLGPRFVLTADDDHVYGAGWADGLLTWAEQLPDCAVGYRGRQLTGKGYRGTRLIQKSRIAAPTQVDILTGAWGACYPSKAFGREIYTDWRAWPSNDDLVIAAHLQRRNVARYVVPAQVSIHATGAQHTAPLSTVNRGHQDRRNDAGLQALGLEG